MPLFSNMTETRNSGVSTSESCASSVQVMANTSFRSWGLSYGSLDRWLVWTAACSRNAASVRLETRPKRSGTPIARSVVLAIRIAMRCVDTVMTARCHGGGPSGGTGRQLRLTRDGAAWKATDGELQVTGATRIEALRALNAGRAQMDRKANTRDPLSLQDTN
jgi:hypothetical protein